jgi:hypothetical protein
MERISSTLIARQQARLEGQHGRCLGVFWVALLAFGLGNYYIALGLNAGTPEPLRIVLALAALGLCPWLGISCLWHRGQNYRRLLRPAYQRFLLETDALLFIVDDAQVRESCSFRFKAKNDSLEARLQECIDRMDEILSILVGRSDAVDTGRNWTKFALVSALFLLVSMLSGILVLGFAMPAMLLLLPLSVLGIVASLLLSAWQDSITHKLAFADALAAELSSADAASAVAQAKRPKA